MVGVDRGNPPAKGGTTAVNLPNAIVVPYGRRRRAGTPAVCITLAEADHSNRYYLRNGEATDFKFSRYIQRVHPNKRPLKILVKGSVLSVGASRDCPIFWVPPIISGTGKATNFKFGTRIHSINRNKSPFKIAGKVAVGVLRTLENF